MHNDAINLDDENQCQDLIEVANLCESRDPSLQRQVTAANFRDVLSDSSAFREYGRAWRANADHAAGFGYIRNYYVNEICVCDLKFFVHPAFWETDTGASILKWAFGEAMALRQQEGRRVILYSDCLPRSEWRKSLLEAHNLAPVRYFHRMEHTLNVPRSGRPLPHGYTLRIFEYPRDLKDWVTVFNAAYAGQWNYTPTTDTIQSQLRNDSRYQSRYDLVLTDGQEQLVGFCLGFVLERDGTQAGWVLELGVTPDLRNQGLGSLLLEEVLRRFGAAGLPKAHLAVDGSNPAGAMRLYERLGFISTSCEILYGYQFD